MSQEIEPGLVYADNDDRASALYDDATDSIAVVPTSSIEKSITVTAPARNEEVEESTVESPKSSWVRAYEAVRNTDKVSRAIDNVKIWWSGRHIDAIDRDIARLEHLQGIQTHEASRHAQRLQASSEHASILDTVRGNVDGKEMPVSHADARQVEHGAIQSRAEAHTAASEKIGAELARKQELKAQFEKNREAARTRIAERFQQKIERNNADIAGIDNAVEEITKNLEVADRIVNHLQSNQEAVRKILDSSDALAADKQAARAIAQELEGRIQDMKSKMQIQKDSIGRHIEKRSALNAQTTKWETIIARKPEIPVVPDEDRLEGFIAETPELSDDAIDVTDLVEEDDVEAKDPRVMLLERMQEMMKMPGYQRYEDEEVRKRVEETGTDDEKILLQYHDFTKQLFAWVESPIETPATGNSMAESDKKKLEVMKQSSDRFSDLLDRANEELGGDGEEEVFVERFMTDEGRAAIEKEGTREQKFIVMLLDYLSGLFEDFWSADQHDKNSSIL